MSFSTTLQSLRFRLFLHPAVQAWLRRAREMRRRLTRQPPTVTVFLQIDDPYSYLLSTYLPDLAAAFSAEIQWRLSDASDASFQPETEMRAEYAIRDCKRLASELGIAFLDKGPLPPVEHRKALMNVVASPVDSLQAALSTALEAYWRGDAATVANLLGHLQPGGSARGMLDESADLRHRLGHYDSATAHYAGEWYCGIDRIPALLEHLSQAGLSIATQLPVSLARLQQVSRITLPLRPPAAARDLPALECFFSFRSPYSYLALQRVSDIADAFGLQLALKPVLPMVMRGIAVPPLKARNIAIDANREARQRGIAFGKLCDPMGAGVERCHAVFAYAESEKRGREFALLACAAIWSQGVDVATDKGLRKVTGCSGLFWPGVIESLRSESWRTVADGNRDAMMAAGCWGVPTIAIGNFAVWGQDRDWLLVRHLEELCDTGDGIIV